MLDMGLYKFKINFVKGKGVGTSRVKGFEFVGCERIVGAEIPVLVISDLSASHAGDGTVSG